MLGCEVEAVEPQMQWMLGEFATTDWPDGFSATVGSVQPYEEKDVLRHLSPKARRVKYPGISMEVFQERERFWVVDERWGLSQINLIKGQWRSWVLEKRAIDDV